MTRGSPPGKWSDPACSRSTASSTRCHREPFARPFRLAAVRARFAVLVAQETERLIDAIEPTGRAELRRTLTGPLAVAAVTNALGFEDADTGAVLGWYDRIVAAVTDITAGRPL